MTARPSMFQHHMVWFVLLLWCEVLMGHARAHEVQAQMHVPRHDSPKATEERHASPRRTEHTYQSAQAAPRSTSPPRGLLTLKEQVWELEGVGESDSRFFSRRPHRMDWGRSSAAHSVVIGRGCVVCEER